ncbi:MAG: glycosyltransferase family 2 protein [Nitrospinaceae bacterium]|nr:glycosyltransferase family 2 protein [Nitrospinaceae bacterium]
MDSTETGISFIIPAYNEENMLAPTIDRLHDALSGLDLSFEIIVVNDGSQDGPRQAAESASNASVFSHPVNTGYGSAIKTGILASRYSWIGIVDADGTYDIEQLPLLVDKMKEGFDMAVVSRENILKMDKPLKRFFRRILLSFINIFISAKIQDPNSGFRIFKKDLAMTFFPFLCNTFSFTTSITIFAMGEGYFVCYVPTNYTERTGISKVRHFRDSLRMIQLIMQGITFFNPVKFYLMLSALLVFFVALPAAALTTLGWSSLALQYVIIGSASTLLLGLGVMVDILRISSTYAIDKNKRLTAEADASD